MFYRSVKKFEEQADQQRRFANFMRTHPNFEGEQRLTAAALDACLGEDSFEEFQGDAAGSDLLEELLPLICWWRELQESAALHLLPRDETRYAGVESVCCALNDLMAALGPALSASCLYHEEPDYRPLFEAFQRYRIWTRRVCSIVHHAWPGLDWSDLDKLV